MALNEGTLDAVNNANFKTIAEMGVINALNHQNVLAQANNNHQARLNILAESNLGQIVNRMNALDPAEAASIGSVVTSDIAEKLSELAASIGAAQQYIKGAQTTLPETGQG